MGCFAFTSSVLNTCVSLIIGTGYFFIVKVIVAFVGFLRIFLLGILILKGLTARRLFKSFGVKGLAFFGN
jgi:hypothetical protein